jgi:cytochrome c-type biogenesis protein
MDLTVSLQAALFAGAISFLSPCVLPLVPPYLCFITGASLEELSDGAAARGTKRRAVIAALMFVLGFTVVFVALGASASYIAMLLRSYIDILSKIAGAFIILMGLNFLGVFRLGFPRPRGALPS